MAQDTGQNIHLYRDIHQKNSTWGSISKNLVDEVSLLIRHLEPRTVLDYGCGKGALIQRLAELFPEITFYGYDPSIPGKDVLPTEKADLVINTDVLEHIPEDELPGVVEEISRISQTVFFNLCHRPADTILANGENAHCTVKPPMWYYHLFQDYFHSITPMPGRKLSSSIVITSSLPHRFMLEYDQLLLAKFTFRERLKYWRRLLLSKVLWGSMKKKYILRAIESGPGK